MQDRLPLNAEGVKSFLASDAVPGIGAVIAARLVDEYGAEAARVLADSPGRVNGVRGLSAEKAAQAGAAIRGLGDTAEVMQLLYSCGVGETFVDRVIEKYGQKAIGVMHTDPYAMVEDVWQLSFFTADKIGRALGIDNGDPRRIRGALVTAVKQGAEAGHLFITREEAAEQSAQYTGLTPDQTAARIDDAVASGRLVSNMGVLYLPVYYKAEKEGAERLRALADVPREAAGESGLPLSDSKGNTYTASQRQAIREVVSSSVSVVTGGPGSGKTTIMHGVLQTLRGRGEKVVMCAPTGRAAKRLSTLTGGEASTIHRLLGYTTSPNRKTKPIEADTIIIDEGSMLEQVLLNHLLGAVRPGTRLVFVGDVDQLPPIGAGSVLHDLIESEAVKVVRLTGNFRQQSGSLISEGAAGILRGEMPHVARGGELELVEEQTARGQHDRILSLVADELPRQRGLSSRDILVVTPQQVGPLGARQLNKDLQQRLNPEGPEIKLRDRIMRLGDPVMQTANSAARKVYNGETGRITAVDTDSQEIEVTYADGNVSTYSRSELSELTLAYATTVHKLQGCEVPNIVMPVSMAHKPMLYRNLLYTGVSRATDLCVLVGEEEALRYGVRNNPDLGRNSNFGRRLLLEDHGPLAAT